jgi:hypothetical protein
LSLLDRISPRETWADLESAADERYRDAERLAAAPKSRRTGAVYLLGYVFEMLVKAAYYRFVGLAATQDVSPVLRGMPTRARYLNLPWQGNRHNVGSLADLLVFERRAQGRPLPTALEAQLVGFAWAVANAHWTETLRYKDTLATEAEVREMFRSVDWLYGQYAVLWS